MKHFNVALYAQWEGMGTIHGATDLYHIEAEDVNDALRKARAYFYKTTPFKREKSIVADKCRGNCGLKDISES